MEWSASIKHTAQDKAQLCQKQTVRRLQLKKQRNHVPMQASGWIRKWANDGVWSVISLFHWTFSDQINGNICVFRISERLVFRIHWEHRKKELSTACDVRLDLICYCSIKNRCSCPKRWLIQCWQLNRQPIFQPIQLYLSVQTSLYQRITLSSSLQPNGYTS